MNAIKIKFTLMGSAYNNRKFDNLLAIRVDNKLIKRIRLTKYLALIVDDALKWDLHIDYVLKKVKKYWCHETC